MIRILKAAFTLVKGAVSLVFAYKRHKKTQRP